MQLNVLNDLAGAMKASDGKKSTIMLLAGYNSASQLERAIDAWVRDKLATIAPFKKIKPELVVSNGCSTVV